MLAEVLAVARRGVQVDVHPLQTKREQVMHPEAAPLAASAHYAPLMSVPVASSQVYWLQRDARGYLAALAAALRGTWGSPKFFAGALAFFPRAAHAASISMGASGWLSKRCSSGPMARTMVCTRWISPRSSIAKASRPAAASTSLTCTSG